MSFRTVTYADLLLEVQTAAGELERLRERALAAHEAGRIADAVAHLAAMQQKEAEWFPMSPMSPAVQLAARLELTREVDELLDAPAPVHGSARLWED